MRVLWTLLATASLFACATWTAPAPPDAPPLAWGLYQIYWGRDYAKHLRREIEPFATRPDYVMFYRDLGRGYPQAPIDAIRAVGAAPIVSQELWHWGGGRARTSLLPALERGDYDAFFRAWARDARRDGRRVLYRFGFEMNGDWFSWSGDPAAFRRVWRRIHGIFRDEGATHVEWVWAPNAVGIPRTPENDMHRYFPGRDVVDWVGVDGYNFGDHHDEWHRWESFAEVFGGVLDAFAERYPHHPVMIAETGSAPGEGGRRAAWIRAAHAELAARPQVRALIWFHYDKRRENEPNWRLDAAPGSLDAFNATFAAPRLAPARDDG